jgi:hypothetical protein
MTNTPVILAGACVGAGLTLIIRSLMPMTPDLRSALARLDGTVAAQQVRASATRAPAVLDRFGDLVLPQLVEALGLRRFRSDLELLSETLEQHALRKVGYPLLGLVFPPLLTTAMAFLGLTLPFVIPAVASVALAAVLFFVPDVDLSRRAAEARAQMRRAVCAYLELVALERAGDAGAVEALERAATIGDSQPFARIRDALLRAELTGAPPWQGLADLAEELNVPELADVADIMRLSGEDGAAVYATLRARAASLRMHLLTQSASTANAASEHMIVPVAFLGIAFMALVGYPLFARILFS